MHNPQYYYYTNGRHIRKDLLVGLVALAVPVTMQTMLANCLDFRDWPTLFHYDLGKDGHLRNMDRDPEIKFFRSLLLGDRVYCLSWRSAVYIWRHK